MPRFTTMITWAEGQTEGQAEGSTQREQKLSVSGAHGSRGEVPPLHSVSSLTHCKHVVTVSCVQQSSSVIA